MPAALQQTTILLAMDDMTWLESIRTTLVTAGYRLSVVAPFDTTEKAISEHKPDVIIATANNTTLMLYESVVQRNLAERPLLVLIMDDIDATQEQHANADIILPPNPAYIVRQLTTFLKLRQENTRLLGAQKHHDTEVAAQKTEIEQQKRIINEIEIIKNAIVRNISHELKTPLLQVKSAISLIKEDIPTSRLVEYAEFATARLEALIKNITMLGSSREMNPSPIIARDVIEYARRSLARAWQNKDQIDRVQIQIDEGLPPILADKQGLSTVLQLLLDNALKFSKEDTKVEILAKRDGAKACITVQDDGIGIPPDQLQTIFDMFYQVDSSSTRRYGGAGVGLPLVRLILDNHNEKIFVESTPNKGSRFYFFLPFAEI